MFKILEHANASARKQYDCEATLTVSEKVATLQIHPQGAEKMHICNAAGEQLWFAVHVLQDDESGEIAVECARADAGRTYALRASNTGGHFTTSSSHFRKFGEGKHAIGLDVQETMGGNDIFVLRRKEEVSDPENFDTRR